MNSEDIEKTLARHEQSHLLAYKDELSEKEFKNLNAQLRKIDWDNLDSLIKSHVINKPETKIPEKLSPAPYYPLLPDSPERSKLYSEAIEKGKKILRAGKVACLTVAGGQGTRLGFDGPKGTYPVTPVKNKTLFQYFAESILRLREKYSSALPWFIMTSELNDSETRKFFDENSFFGLEEDSVHFFTQGTMPAVGYDGKVLLKSKSSLALAPDGHGGTLLALKKSGSLDLMKSSGIEYISYFQVDNPLVSVADPLFIGLHHLEKSQISARALIKTGPYEKLGNFCVSEGKLQIIEYSDMPDKLAKDLNQDGSLKFAAGSPAIHILSLEFVEKLTNHGRLKLPWHRADKKVCALDSSGILKEPEEPNAVKLESFIFDALPLASKTMVLAADRNNEFAPVKNPSGVDSAESCRAMLIERDSRRLEHAGFQVPRKADGSPDCIVEISPLCAADDEDFKNYANENNISVPSRGAVIYCS